MVCGSKSARKYAQSTAAASHQASTARSPASSSRAPLTCAMRRPKKRLSQSRSAHAAIVRLAPDGEPDRVGRLVHEPEVRARQVLADDAEREQLGARKD